MQQRLLGELGSPRVRDDLHSALYTVVRGALNIEESLEYELAQQKGGQRIATVELQVQGDMVK